MPISPRDFQKACQEFKQNWPGGGNDGKTVAQRLDQLQSAVIDVINDINDFERRIEKMEATSTVTEDRVKQLVADAVRQLPPPPPAGMTEARVKQLIAAAILDQHPLDEVAEDNLLITEENGDAILLENASGDRLLIEAASPHRSSVVTWSDH